MTLEFGPISIVVERSSSERAIPTLPSIVTAAPVPPAASTACASTAERRSHALFGTPEGSTLRFRDRSLDPVAAKVLEGRRLTLDDGRVLYDTPDLHGVLRLADTVRRRLHGDRAYYNANRHINYSNICALSCRFCAFYRKRGDDGAYEMSIDQIVSQAKAADAAGATELHIVGGLHPWLPFEWYTQMLAAIRLAAPRLHLKAFTAVEIVHLVRISKRGSLKAEGVRQVLGDLKAAGLGSLPGGGAEVFDDRVHDEAFKGKIRAEQWLEVHRVAHELGLNSNVTMLYGHVESRDERLHHFEVIRRQQDRTLREWAMTQCIESSRSTETDDDHPAIVLTGPPERYARQRLPDGGPDRPSRGYFQTIIPLPFFPDASALESLPAPTGLENLRTLAIARLMLDNIPHVKAFWIMQTLAMAQLMLQSGADDIDGTVVWYDITKAVGEGTHQETTVRDLRRAIREAGCTPVERDTLYRTVERHGTEWRVADA